MQELEDPALPIPSFDVRFIPHILKGPIAAEDDRIIMVIPTLSTLSRKRTLIDFGFS